MFPIRRAAHAALFTSAVALGLTACGGGSSPVSPSPVSPSAPIPAPPPPGAPTVDEAARFLSQATFGPTESDIARVQALGFGGWVDEQIALPRTSHLPYVQANYNLLLFGGNFAFMQDSFWQQAIPAQDQLDRPGVVGVDQERELLRRRPAIEIGTRDRRRRGQVLTQLRAIAGQARIVHLRGLSATQLDDMALQQFVPRIVVESRSLGRVRGEDRQKEGKRDASHGHHPSFQA